MKNLLFLFAAVLLFSCDTNVKVKTSDGSEGQEINLKDLLGGSDESGEKIKALDFRELKEEFPRKIIGIKKSSSEGERAGALGINYSKASAEYHDEDTKIDVTVVDIGEAKSLMKMMAQWTTLEMDRESDDGYERVDEIDGHKALIQYNNRNNSGERVIIIDDRLIVTVSGRNVSDKDLGKAVDDLDLSNLQDLID